MVKQPELRARCTEAELAALAALARKEHLRPTELLRQLVRDAARELGVWPPSDNGQESDSEKL